MNCIDNKKQLTIYLEYVIIYKIKKRGTIMKLKSRYGISIIMNLIIVIFEIIGTSISLSGGINNLIYYTVESNIFALISSICYLIFAIKKEDMPEWIKIIRYMASCFLTMTFCVVVFLFTPMLIASSGDVLSVLVKGPQIYHHVLCPLISVVSFILFEPKIKFYKKYVTIALIPTLIYSVVLVTLNILKVVHGPYMFFYVHEQSIFVSVIYFVVLNASAMFFDFIILKLKSKLIKGE